MAVSQQRLEDAFVCAVQKCLSIGSGLTAEQLGATPEQLAETMLVCCRQSARALVHKSAPRAFRNGGSVAVVEEVGRACAIAVVEWIVVRWIDELCMFGEDPQRPWLTWEFASSLVASLLSAVDIAAASVEPALIAPRISFARLAACQRAGAALAQLEKAERAARKRKHPG